MEGYNTKRLANVLANRMKDTSNAAVQTTIELGTYNDDGSITPDGLRSKIPKGSYMINFMLTDDDYTTFSTVNITNSKGEHEQEVGTGEHEHLNDGSHRHAVPKKLRPLDAGDRILIAWCGTEPVVIAKVISS